MNAAESLVREFCDAWSKLDADMLTEYFTDDGVYHNMPMAPLEGKDAIRGFLAGFLAGVTTAEFRMLNVVASDDVVMTERIDSFTIGATAKKGDFPVCGVFEIRDGKIAAWRDYFDMAQVTAFLTGG
jgi:limonene-1,2-epoxide hydrolase